jgi:hypothetical protein
MDSDSHHDAQDIKQKPSPHDNLIPAPLNLRSTPNNPNNSNTLRPFPQSGKTVILSLFLFLAMPLSILLSAVQVDHFSQDPTHTCAGVSAGKTFKVVLLALVWPVMWAAVRYYRFRKRRWITRNGGGENGDSGVKGNNKVSAGWSLLVGFGYLVGLGVWWIVKLCV